jgi:hypothetical protein
MDRALPSADAPSPFDERSDPGFWLRAAPGGPLVAFTTRRGGVSRGAFESLNLGLGLGDAPEAVRENRRLLLAALGTGDCARLSQVHGVAVVEPAGPGEAGEGDVLVTRRQGLALAVSVADCLPIVLWDGSRTALAAVHAGWRGVVTGVLEAAIRWLAERARVEALRAAIGPGIRACCFEVGPEVASRFPADFQRSDSEKLRVDLAAAATARLRAAGVPPSGIEDLRQCTACDAERYFSHRRDRGRTGRHWAVARLAPAEAASSPPTIHAVRRHSPGGRVDPSSRAP